MNNMNTPVYLIISARFRMHSEAFHTELRKQVVKQLNRMNRLFSDNEFEKATRDMDYLKFTIGGVDFSVLRG